MVKTSKTLSCRTEHDKTKLVFNKYSVYNPISFIKAVTYWVFE